MITIWIAFIVSLSGILILSRRSLPLALISGALFLGFATLPFNQSVNLIFKTIIDPSTLFLVLAMGIIPLVGGVMKKGGQIDKLVNNIRVSQRYLLPISTALMGFLPMPGGALLSAPILEKGGAGVDNHLKAAINNWFRHLIIFVYPLSSALIVSAEIARLDVYRAILYLLPALLIAFILGYVFFLRKVPKQYMYHDSFSPIGLLVPLLIILAAPAIDFTLKKAAGFGNSATLIAVSISLGLSIILSERRVHLGGIIKSMKPWNFALIIFGMFLYMNVFQESGISELIKSIPLPPLILSITAGFVLGIATGRVHLPASIILPVYLASVNDITPIAFVLIYVAIFFGYVTSPVHPCLVVTCQYFNVSIRAMLRKLAAPTIVILAIVYTLSLIISVT
ncbi:MAG: DUF401 family protein [candidate division Zixibacteria bacterium]|nr:DUF401 family protein [candidate division Zixibacteria bacterium]